MHIHRHTLSRDCMPRALGIQGRKTRCIRLGDLVNSAQELDVQSPRTWCSGLGDLVRRTRGLCGPANWGPRCETGARTGLPPGFSQEHPISHRVGADWGQQLIRHPHNRAQYVHLHQTMYAWAKVGIWGPQRCAQCEVPPWGLFECPLTTSLWDQLGSTWVRVSEPEFGPVGCMRPIAPLVVPKLRGLPSIGRSLSSRVFVRTRHETSVSSRAPSSLRCGGPRSRQQ